MASTKIDHAALFADSKYFAQLPTFGKITPPPETSSVKDTVFSVAKQLLGEHYKLREDVVPSKNPDGSEVYDLLTQALPVLSEQSKFYWERAARTLASMLDTAKYPIHSQTSHLVFWWARLGGLNGPTVKGQTKEQLSEFTRDGSCVEFSWVIAPDTEPTGPCNRKIRFGIDPFHPDLTTRLAGGAVTDYLWSEAGGLGIVSQKGGKDWRDKVEKWLFPNLESTEQVVPGCTYFVGFDLEPSGSITLKHYLMPPAPDPNVDHVFKSATNRLTSDLAPFRPIVAQLHPSLSAPLEVLIDFLSNEGKDSGLLFAMVACDLKPLKDNRLKLYMWTPRHTLKQIVHNLTLGGKLKGPKYDADIADLKKLFKNLFPYATDENIELHSEHLIDDVPEAYQDEQPGRHDAGLLYYFELFVDEPNPYTKVYFLMDFFGKNDLKTAQSVEGFFKEIGKPGQPGWFAGDIGRAVPHRDLAARTGTQTGFSFGIKPKGWDVTGYYSPEVYRIAEELAERAKKQKA
ncbi:7-dimethylallyltryptophan synthase [Favolaschia claudopus]|uniref:7-dimethylallyltryptophan synthase n=1 Tax=Favolaschia claudopus TaxID=2862362 RepID=A0AAW0DXU2_9AGAR